MKEFSGEKIKNVALLGHGGSGKTTLADALLFYYGKAEKIGKIADSSVIMDFDPQEKARKSSIYTSVYAVDTDSYKLNLIDAPGQFDFAAGSVEALMAADSVVVAVSGKSGLTVGAKQSLDKALALKKSTFIFIGKLDSTHAHFYRVVSSLVARYGAVICPLSVPIYDGEELKGIVDLIDYKAYAFDGIGKKEINFTADSECEQMHNMLLEAIASTDDALMEKYFSGESFTKAEMLEGLKKGVLSGEIFPVFAGIQSSGAGVSILADAIETIAPSAAEKGFKNDGEDALFVFKTIADPFVGRLSYFKVISGEIKPDTKLINGRTNSEERLSKIMFLKAGKQENADKISAGDIGCASKLGNVLTGDTLSKTGKASADKLDFPIPTLMTAVYPKNKGDEEKIASGFARICEEDPTVKTYNDPETHEFILSALGEQHIDTIVTKLKTKFNVEVVLKPKKIAYRETIKKPVKVQGRYKKQSGGHGQFGDVWIEFEPTSSDELVFEEKVFGGAVPKNFFPAVEKGLKESAKKGVLAGFPTVGIKATLVDGSYHPVDSSEMSFKTAASIAYKEGVPNAAPVLLEPIVTLTVVAPDEMLGDVIGDINKRRGRIVGMNPTGDKMQEIVSEAPEAELSDFSTSLRSITQGNATFNTEFARYEEVPAQLSQKIIEEYKEQ